MLVAVETDEHIEEAKRATKEFRDAGFTGVVYLMTSGRHCCSV